MTKYLTYNKTSATENKKLIQHSTKELLQKQKLVKILKFVQEKLREKQRLRRRKTKTISWLKKMTLQLQLKQELVKILKFAREKRHPRSNGAQYIKNFSLDSLVVKNIVELTPLRNSPFAE